MIGVYFTKILSHTARYISVNAFLFLISECTYGAAAQSGLIRSFPVKRSNVDLECYPPLLFAPPLPTGGKHGQGSLFSACCVVAEVQNLASLP